MSVKWNKKDHIEKYNQLNIDSLIPRRSKKNMLWAIYLLSEKVGIDNIQFHSQKKLACQVDEIDSIQLVRYGKEDQYDVCVNVGGLNGINGCLPAWLSELVNEEDIDNYPLGDFLDIFSHLLVKLNYRTWINFKPHFSYKNRGKDQISQILFSFLGIRNVYESHSKDNSEGFIPARLLSYIALMGHFSKSASALQRILTEYFSGISIKIEENIPYRVEIPKEDRSCLGRQATQLAVNIVSGQFVMDHNGYFRIIIGPLDYENYMAFQYKSKKYELLNQILTYFVPKHLKWEIVLHIKKEAIPNLQLGKRQLGKDMWIPAKKKEDSFIKIVC